jgi:hypothetical protein
LAGAKQEDSMANPVFRRLVTVKTLIRVAFTAISVASIGVAHSAPAYHHPPQNDYQNNWSADR